MEIDFPWQDILRTEMRGPFAETEGKNMSLLLIYLLAPNRKRSEGQGKAWSMPCNLEGKASDLEPS